MPSMIRTVQLMLPLTLFCNGCVVFQIRDELRATNARLDEIEKRVVSVEQTVASSDSSLKSINESMEPISVSLRRIDDELAGFRQTIDKIDKVIPGKISPDIPPPAPQAPTSGTMPRK